MSKKNKKIRASQNKNEELSRVQEEVVEQERAAGTIAAAATTAAAASTNNANRDDAISADDEDDDDVQGRPDAGPIASQNRAHRVVQQTGIEAAANSSIDIGALTQVFQNFNMLEAKIEALEADWKADSVEKLGLKKFDRWPFSDILFEDPDIKGSEREVQAKFEDFLEKIRSRVDRSLLTSIPIMNAHNTASFGRRKPDLVNAAIGMTGELAITSFGECKKPGPNDFTDEQVGHILGMAQVYLTKHAFHRHFLIVYLTDGRRWQFFRVQRNGSELQYQKAPVIDNPMEGWLYFLKLLTANLAEIGYLEPQVEDTELTQVLGRGGSSSVYKGMHNEEKEPMYSDKLPCFLISAYKAPTSRTRQSASLSLQRLPELRRPLRALDITRTCPSNS